MSEKENLELVVRVININQGKNETLVRKSKTLAEYSAFIAKVRECEKEAGDRTEGMTQAVKYCREHDILKAFLEKHGTEVINMLYVEWDQEEALAVRYEEGREQGIEQGIEQGMERGRGQGLEQTARNALAEGVPVELVQKITGLDLETIKALG